MKRESLVLAIVLSLLAPVCLFAQEEVVPPHHGFIKGKVTDTETPRPNNLPGAIVTVESELLLGAEARTATTDAAGNYEIINLPPGEYVLTANKPGYDESADYVTVVPGGVAFHDVRLYKTDTFITYLWNTWPARWPLLFFFLLLLLSVSIAAIYIINRIRKRPG